MDILDLRCFLKLVEEGSVTKAANALHMSQPNLSRHLLRLEDELGSQLYERDAKRAKLTEAGHKLFDYATTVVSLVDEAALIVGKRDTEPRGQVRIGFGDAEATAYILEAIVATRQKYPAVEFQLFAGDSLRLLGRLDSGQADFVLEVEHIPRVGYHELLLPGTNQWGVYPLPETRLSQLTCVTPEDLAGEPLIVSRQFLKSSIFKHWAGDNYGQLHPVVYTDIFPSEWRLLVKGRVGHMLGYLYFQGEEATVAGVRGIPFEPALITTNALIWKKGRNLTSAQQVFLDELRAIIEPGV